MKEYQATTLRDLKQAGSGIHVMVEAMPLSGMNDGNGGYICSLVREGIVIPATINQTVYDFTQKVDGIYTVQGRWNGTQLEVHHAFAKSNQSFGKLTDKKPDEPNGPMYSDDLSFIISRELARKKRIGL
jgi:hypothetical protein